MARQDRFGPLSQPTERPPEKAKKGSKSLVDFRNDLKELSKAFPVSQRPYDRVNVLLLCWDETDQRNKI